MSSSRRCSGVSKMMFDLRGSLNFTVAGKCLGVFAFAFLVLLIFSRGYVATISRVVE